MHQRVELRRRGLHGVRSHGHDAVHNDRRKLLPVLLSRPHVRIESRHRLICCARFGIDTARAAAQLYDYERRLPTIMTMTAITTITTIDSSTTTTTCTD